MNPSETLDIFLKLDKNELTGLMNKEVFFNSALLVLFVIISSLISVFFAKKLSSPIIQLMELTQRISRGEPIDLSVEKIKANDEIGLLTKTLLKMSSDLVTQNHELVWQKEIIDSSAIVAETDVKGKITYVNKSFVEISKYTEEELIGHDHRIINSGHHSKEFIRDMWQTITSGKTWRGEIKNRAKDGTYYWVDTSIHPIPGKNNKIEKFVAIRFDITARKEAEANLINQTKMASLGHMAGGIAHEINNPLAIISLANMSIKKFLAKSNAPENIYDMCEKVDRTALRIGNIVSGLQAISRDGSKDPMQIENLKVILDYALGVCIEKFKNDGIDIQVEGHLDHSIYCRGGQIAQVLVNLLVNAHYAVRNQEDPWIKLNCSGSGDSIVISVIDSGFGIKDPERIMDPFYTTKPVGQGTGLGLSISSSIAKDHGGELRYDSKSVNTKFDLILNIVNLKKAAA
ncbi:MAG: PAS domain S-box protein [Bdellovibrionales bacterium]